MQIEVSIADQIDIQVKEKKHAVQFPHQPRLHQKHQVYSMPLIILWFLRSWEI